MPKNSVDDWDTSSGNNTDIAGINIAEGCAPQNINDAIRTVMSQVADWRDTLPTLAGTETVSGSWVFTGSPDFSGVANAPTIRTDLGLAIGTDVQAYDADLAAISGLTSAANTIVRYTGAGTADLVAFLDEDDMASDSASGIPSQQSVKAYVDGAAIGAGQTPQDVSGSRAHSTIYHNNTGGPIYVYVQAGSTGTARNFELSATGAFAGEEVAFGRVGGGTLQNAHVIVPNDYRYRVNGSVTIGLWAELRA